MAIKLTDSIRVGQQKPLDDKYFNGLVPYISTAEVNRLISINVRHRGLTVNINGEEYWYKDGIEDANLVLKVPNLDTKLDKGGYTGTAQDLKNSIDGKANTSHTHNISDVTNLQTTLNNKLDKGNYTGTAQDLKNEIDTKQKKLSSFDESILIEPDGNIEGNVSLFTEYFQQQVCELNFIPTQIIGVYKNGVKLLPEEFNITLPKKITIKTYSTEKIEIQYTHLKNN